MASNADDVLSEFSKLTVQQQVAALAHVDDGVEEAMMADKLSAEAAQPKDSQGFASIMANLQSNHAGRAPRASSATPVALPKQEAEKASGQLEQESSSIRKPRTTTQLSGLRTITPHGVYAQPNFGQAAQLNQPFAQSAAAKADTVTRTFGDLGADRPYSFDPRNPLHDPSLDFGGVMRAIHVMVDHIAKDAHRYATQMTKEQFVALATANGRKKSALVEKFSSLEKVAAFFSTARPDYNLHRMPLEFVDFVFGALQHAIGSLMKLAEYDGCGWIQVKAVQPAMLAHSRITRWGAVIKAEERKRQAELQVPKDVSSEEKDKAFEMMRKLKMAEMSRANPKTKDLAAEARAAADNFTKSAHGMKLSMREVESHEKSPVLEPEVTPDIEPESPDEELTRYIQTSAARTIKKPTGPISEVSGLPLIAARSVAPEQPVAATQPEQTSKPREARKLEDTQEPEKTNTLLDLFSPERIAERHEKLARLPPMPPDPRARRHITDSKFESCLKIVGPQVPLPEAAKSLADFGPLLVVSDAPVSQDEDKVVIESKIPVPEAPLGTNDVTTLNNTISAVHEAIDHWYILFANWFHRSQNHSKRKGADKKFKRLIVPTVMADVANIKKIYVSEHVQAFKLANAPEPLEKTTKTAYNRVGLEFMPKMKAIWGEDDEEVQMLERELDETYGIIKKFTAEVKKGDTQDEVAKT